MALWHCNLQPSAVLMRLSLLLHGLLLIALCSVPWPEAFQAGKWLLLAGIVVEFLLTRQRLQALQGELQLTTPEQFFWHGQNYTIAGRPL
ncbi:MAG: protein YgfX, partial [Enterobacteriaceae bacterium]